MNWSDAYGLFYTLIFSFFSELLSWSTLRGKDNFAVLLGR